MSSGVSIYQDTVCRKPLGTVASDGVAVIKVGIRGGVKLDLSSTFKRQRHIAISDLFDSPCFPVRHAELLLGCSELKTITGCELPFHWLVDGHARQPFWI